jgi:hypothetical protein
MTEIWDGKTIEELTTLVRQELDELGGSAVRFIIRPLPYGGRIGTLKRTGHSESCAATSRRR